jgi:hypothetical protein
MIRGSVRYEHLPHDRVRGNTKVLPLQETFVLDRYCYVSTKKEGTTTSYLIDSPLVLF